MPKQHIAIAGIIGVGKSTLAEGLTKRLDAALYQEPVKENPYLDDFYKDMGAYAFQMQMFLLYNRFEQTLGISKECGFVVQDRSIYEDQIFAKLLHDKKLITDRDYDTYISSFKIMISQITYPDLILYLDVSPELALQRIQTRGRACEKEISLEYLQALRRGYETWLKQLPSEVKIIRLDWRAFDSVNSVLKIIQSTNGTMP
jgi:deoxyadenosine kinase